MFKSRRIAVLAVGMTAMGGVVAGAAPASASVVLPLKNFAVYGSLTPKKLNEPVVLPKGSTFNGRATFSVLSPTETVGTVNGNLFVPPFTASLKLVGLVPTQVHLTLTEVGESTGTIVSAPQSECAHSRVAGECVSVAVTSKANIGIVTAGLLGIEVPTNCETSEPVTLPLNTTEPLTEVTSEAHFAGTVTIPSIKCEGLQGIALGILLTELMSGPGNPYSIGLAPKEPTAPVVETLPATSVSQISAHLLGTALPSGEPLTGCKFEYGTSTSYGASVACAPQGPRFPPADIETATVTGLSEGTEYHYRIAATNSLGTSDGADQVFQTPGPGNSAEYGGCVAQKHGVYSDAGCLARAKRSGKFEWKPGPAPTCFAKTKGEYTDSSCTLKSAKPRKGTFEKEAGAHFTLTSGVATLESPAFTGKLVCAAGTGAGEITGATRGQQRVEFSGCEMSGKKCTSEGTNSTSASSAGDIATNLLSTRLLGPVATTFAGQQVWTDLASAEHEPYLAEFGCEGTRFRISGSSSGVQAGDVGVMSANGETRFEAAEGEQNLLAESSENGGSSWSSASPSTALLTLASTAELPTEIRP